MAPAMAEDKAGERGWMQGDEERTEEAVEGKGETFPNDVVEEKGAGVGSRGEEIRERDEGPRVRSRVRKKGVGGGGKGLRARSDIHNNILMPRHAWAADACVSKNNACKTN